MSEPAAPSAIACVKVDVTLPGEGLSEAEDLKLRARYAAGVQLIANEMGASEVQAGESLTSVLFFTGTHAPTLARHAFQAARLLRERVTIDLNLPARLAVHAIGLAKAEVEEAQRTLQEQCERLQRTTSTNTITVSPEMYLVLSDEDRQHLSPVVADDVDARFWARFQEHLNSPVVRRLRYVGFRLQKKEPPSLDIFDVFVVPTVGVRGVRPDFVALADSEQPALTAPQTLSFPEAFRKYRSLVVLGDPGSGKTTLLRWLGAIGAGGALSMHAQFGEGSTLLPLLVSVGRLAEIKATLGDTASVIQAMARYFHERGVEQDEGALTAFLERNLSAGQCLVLLDGLDEVQSESREGIMRWLETFSVQYPQNRYIASARHVGYTGLELPRGAELTLGPFDDAQVRQYVQAFQRAYRRWEEGLADDVTADRDTSRLLDAIFANQRLHDLSRNPFILSSLALIHRAEGQLPRHRVQAYEILARTLCETWSYARRLTASAPQEQEIRYEEEAIPILGRLALEMHRQWPTGVAPEQFVIDMLAFALQEREGSELELARRSAREFLKRAGENVQILLERGPGQWGFLHLTFQEFFAAVGLHATEAFEEEVMSHLFEPRWEEILRLGVGYMALVQKRAEGARRFIVRILEHKEEGKRAFLTEVLRKQVLLATLAAIEAGDALPIPLQERIAHDFAHWLYMTPWEISLASFMDVKFSELAKKLVEPLKQRPQGLSLYAHINALAYLGGLQESLTPSILWHDFERLYQGTQLAEEIVASYPRQPRVDSALQFVDDPSMGIRPLLNLTKTPDAELRKQALFYLAVIAPHQALPAALEASQDENPALRRASISVLRGVKTPQTTECLLSLLEDEDSEVRRTAAHALGSHKAEEAISALVRLSTSPNDKERKTALMALWSIAGALPPARTEH